MRITYISWAPHCSRSDYTARALGGRSHMVYWGWLGSHPATVWLKYLGQTFGTWRVLAGDRPDVAFVMTPPPIAILAVYAYCVVFRKRFVVDAHTGVFVTARWRWFQGIQFWLCRRAATTIVTNEHIAALMRQHGAAATIVPDVPIHSEGGGAVPVDTSRFTVVCVTSFDRDEPIAAMIEAARRLPDVPFLMTGDWRSGAQTVPPDLPPNLVLTGFLSAASYGALLRQAGVVIALTTDDHTMQRGAYEAIYHGTPVIVSETDVLREAFDEGAAHVDNSPGAIVEAIGRVRAAADDYRTAARRLRERKLARWEHTRLSLLQVVEGRPAS